MLTDHRTKRLDRCPPRPGTARQRMLGALRMWPVDRPPVWLMRQAGRHLPQYRALRERMSFLDLCRDPDANAMVSAEPLARYGVDGAIVFNDILIPLRDMGMALDFDPGPRFRALIATPHDVAALAQPAYCDDAQVCSCIRALRQSVGEHAVLGFIGAPFTVAAFAIAGSGPQRAARICDDVLARRGLYESMQERLLPVLVSYAVAQVSAGADVIQVFESLAHDTGHPLYRDAGLPYLRRTIKELRTVLPETPIIVFGRGLWPFVVEIAHMGPAAVSLDETAPLAVARRALVRAGLPVPLQGNLRPHALLESQAAARDEAEALVRSWPTIVPWPARAHELGPTGWVFNLGHGVPAAANPDAVQAVVDIVKTFNFCDVPASETKP